MQTFRRLIKRAIKSLFGQRLAGLWQSPQEELVMFQDEMRKGMLRIPDSLANKVGLFAHFNSGGSQPPLFWCFNLWSEAALFAYHLGPDRPLYAMHSLCGITYDEAKKSMHTAKIAEIYSDLICDIYPDGLVVLGGNCQAGRIAEATAHCLLERRGHAPMLLTVDAQPFYAYPGELVMLFGDQSESFNPFLGKEPPTLRWQNKHQNAVWGFIEGPHGEYFREPGVHQLTGYVKRCSDHFADGVRLPSGEMALSTAKDDLSQNLVDQNPVDQNPADQHVASNGHD